MSGLKREKVGESWQHMASLLILRPAKLEKLEMSKQQIIAHAQVPFTLVGAGAWTGAAGACLKLSTEHTKR